MKRYKSDGQSEITLENCYILIFPSLLNYVVAIYLIVAGVMGLAGHRT